MSPSKEIKTDTHTLREIVESLNDFLTEGFFRSSENKLAYVNAAFLKMFGYNSFEEAIVLPENSFYADEEAHIHLVDHIHSMGFIIDHRVLYKKKSGKTFWGSLTGRRTLRKGSLIFEGRILDISDLLTIEAQLEEKKIELEKLSMELDRFIYSASHDIRSPITTILGIINLMKLDLKDEETKAYIRMMETTVGKLDHFVRELVGHAKNSKTIIDDRSINFDSLIHNIFEELKKTHPAFSLITPNLEIDHAHRFYSDPERVQLILFNIIKNAVDYYDSNKADQVLSVIIKTDPEKVFIEIFDNGIGISATHVHHVFDMFYRASLQSKGSGIGLYTAREAVIKLGGVITLDSVFGIGTSIKIKIPNSKKGRLINKKSELKIHKGNTHPSAS